MRDLEREIEIAVRDDRASTGFHQTSIFDAPRRRFADRGKQAATISQAAEAAIRESPNGRLRIDEIAEQVNHRRDEPAKPATIETILRREDRFVRDDDRCWRMAWDRTADTDDSRTTEQRIVDFIVERGPSAKTDIVAGTKANAATVATVLSRSPKFKRNRGIWEVVEDPQK